MRGALSIILRWWRGANGNGRGHGPDTLAEGAPSDLHTPGRDPTREPPWLAELDREGIPRSLQYPTTTLGRLLDQAAERFGDTPAVVYNQKRWTYRELLGCVNRMAGGLSRYGVRQGDRVVLALPNCPEYVISFFALQKLGALVVNAGPLMGSDDLRHLITLTTPRVVIGLDLQASKLIGAANESSPDRLRLGHAPVIPDPARQTRLPIQAVAKSRWSRRLAGHAHGHRPTLENAPARPPTVEPSPDATAVLQPTSGTTGSLKLVQLSHRSLLANATQVTVWMGAREGQERLLTILPMFHVYGLTTGLISPIFCAATITLMTRFDAAQTLDVLEQEPDRLPDGARDLRRAHREIERRAPRSVTLPMHASVGRRRCPRGRRNGSSVSPGARRRGLRPDRGLTGHARQPAGAATVRFDRPADAGHALPVVDLEDGEHDVAVGEPGELLVAGPQVMSGYFGNPEETQRVLSTDEPGRTVAPHRRRRPDG